MSGTDLLQFAIVGGRGPRLFLQADRRMHFENTPWETERLFNKYR